MTLRELIQSVDSEQYSDSEASDFWSDFDNLQKAKIIR